MPVNQIIIGDKIILRPLKLSDAADFVRWLKDPEVNKTLTRRESTLQEQEGLIQSALNHPETEKIFAIDTKNGEHIGSAGLIVKQFDKNAEFFLLIGEKKYWGLGYGNEVLFLLFNHGFLDLQLNKIYFDILSINYKVRRWYKKYKILGGVKEGNRKQHYLYNGKYYDAIQIGVLKKDWLKYRHLIADIKAGRKAGAVLKKILIDLLN